ncbi:MAG: hypothetical protein GC131_06115 [Alphaproteobacteria bacterium]|nr:hypothetical protein [Alphaproteobacteria bacterium]
MKESLDLGPVELSYAAALRGVQPRVPGQAFTYARFCAGAAEDMLCLAASNPEGKFFFFLEDENEAAAARSLAQQGVVTNAAIAAGHPAGVLEQQQGATPPLPRLDYLCCDDTALSLTDADREALFTLSAATLGPQGLFACRYRPFARQDESLRYLINVLEPLLEESQKMEFVQELQALGGRYFARVPAARALLDKALAEGKPEHLLESATGAVVSATMGTMQALLPRQMMYVGDASIASNYMDLSTPEAAHALLLKMKDSVMYEPAKDFAADRSSRTDIWCPLAAALTGNPAALFNGFFFGSPAPGDAIPPRITVNGRTYDLTTPLHARLIKLMRIMPITIGDFLHHEDSRDAAGQLFAPMDVVAAVHLLVALGVATPMRATYTGYTDADYGRPCLAGPFNRAFWRDGTGARARLAASTVTGRAIRMDAREALVLQALTAGGFEGSAHVLLPALQKLASDPTQSMAVLGGQMPDEDVAANLISDVCERDLVGWYAFGVLAA